jgi:hypothetical protein
VRELVHVRWLADGGTADTVPVMREKPTSPLAVYTLDVEEFHTYFVAGSGVWVHNCGESVASVGNYRANVYAENPETPVDFQIHHSLPQKYADLMADAGIDIHNNEFLRGVSRPIHQLINSDWSASDRGYGGTPPASSVHQFATFIDQQYGSHFVFPH